MNEQDKMKPLSELMTKKELERVIDEQVREIVSLCDKLHESNRKLEHLEGKDGWTPVTEELPEKAGHYLVTTELNYYHGGNLDTNKDGTTKSIAVAYYDGTDKIGGQNYWNKPNVLAWRHLPNPF